MAVLGALAAVGLAWALTKEGWAIEQAGRYKLAARGLEPANDWSARQRRIGYLSAVVSLTPSDAEQQQALADALYESFRAEKAELRAQDQLAQAARLVLSVANYGPGFGSVAVAATRPALHPSPRQEDSSLLQRALARYVLTRQLCPLLPRPHVCLAAHTRELTGEAGAASVHLGRARLLVPYNGSVWFFSGAQALLEGDRDEACRHWRRSLLCSREYLEEILVRSRRHLSPEQMVASVLPDDPELLYQAAVQLAPESETAPRPLLRRAVELLRERPGEPNADVLLLEARALVRLGRPAEAVDAFERLEARSPRGVDWRYEFAQVLHEQGRLAEARRELRTLLQQQPDHTRGKDLYQKVLRRQGEGN
jgi:tetratricopeptide (TPR) repeat protein